MTRRIRPQRLPYRGDSDWREEPIGVEELMGYFGKEILGASNEEPDTIRTLRRDGLLNEIEE